MSEEPTQATDNPAATGTETSTPSHEGQPQASPAQENLLQASLTEGDFPKENAASQAPKNPSENTPPEKYSFTPPEGYSLDEKQMEGFYKAARDAGLTQEQFQHFGEAGTKLLQAEIDRISDAQSKQTQLWLNEVLNDKTISNGEDLTPEAREAASRVIDAYGGDALRKALSETGAGNNPAIIRAFIQIGKAMGQTPGLQTNSPSPNQKRPSTFSELARTLYGGPS